MSGRAAHSLRTQFLSATQDVVWHVRWCGVFPDMKLSFALARTFRCRSAPHHFCPAQVGRFVVRVDSTETPILADDGSDSPAQRIDHTPAMVFGLPAEHGLSGHSRGELVLDSASGVVVKGFLKETFESMLNMGQAAEEGGVASDQSSLLDFLSSQLSPCDEYPDALGPYCGAGQR